MVEEPDRVAMLSDVTALRSDVTALRSDVTVLRSDVTALETSVRSDVTSLRLDVVALRSDLTALEERLEKRMKADHEETRRHFDIMVEKVETTVKLALEVNAHHGIILDDHENRLKKIEGRR